MIAFMKTMVVCQYEGHAKEQVEISCTIWAQSYIYDAEMLCLWGNWRESLLL